MLPRRADRSLLNKEQVKRSFSDWQQANFNRHKAEHAEEVARERLRLLAVEAAELDADLAGCDVYVTHDACAAEVGVTRRCVIKWIHEGKLKAEPKPDNKRKYQIKLAEWERFKDFRRAKKAGVL